MVQTDQWAVQWFGKMSKAKFAIVMLSEAYWKSGPCTEEVMKILEKGLRVFIVRVDDTCASCMQGNFLGDSAEQVTKAGFIKTKMNMNCLPPPYKPLFQDDFAGNAATLVSQIRASVYGSGLPNAPEYNPAMVGADVGPPIDVADADTASLTIVLQAKVDAWQPGRWMLLGLLGRGGSGVVFQAADRRLGNTALKFVSTGTAAMQQKAKREMAILQRVHHPNICAVHGSQAFPAGHVFCMVLELLDAGSLQERLVNGGPLSEPDVVRMASHVLAALACAHGQEIVHRDIKPANILIQSQGPSGQPIYKVCDFGIAVATRSGQASMQTTMQTGTFGMEAAIGTPHYMSPEQLQAGEEPDSRTDLWSLGVVMSECFTGK